MNETEPLRSPPSSAHLWDLRRRRPFTDEADENDEDEDEDEDEPRLHVFASTREPVATNKAG
ncbi:MAG: hypothetical protein M1815_005173 [Lichina confinis]|nr:MAG: hypothetical protein M1815_005173 [Lichina confinis]